MDGKPQDGKRRTKKMLVCKSKTEKMSVCKSKTHKISVARPRLGKTGRARPRLARRVCCFPDALLSSSTCFSSIRIMASIFSVSSGLSNSLTRPLRNLHSSRTSASSSSLLSTSLSFLSSSRSMRSSRPCMASLTS
ncbi:hypothetical protein BDZ89DRAFT_242893 [Hymenopellis radicata]|nr:hypothetical protein BDZ89DRAFT_242893 [Hymenopellis radicata]